jgi:hypothetical protein
MDELEHEVAAVRLYIEGQMTDVNVTGAQRLVTRTVVGNQHEIWDVRVSDGTRWWVITRPMNFYSQGDFVSVEQALVYHLGVGVMMADHYSSPPDDEVRDLLGATWRRYEQADKAHGDAHEAAEFQAVGVHCRETLISLVVAIREQVPDEVEPDDLKAGDFVGWATLGATELATGRLRKYLVTLIKPAWDLTVWLQHYAHAGKWDSALVLTSTEHTIAMFTQAILRERDEPKELCPRCQSRRVDSAFGFLDDAYEDYWNEKVCVPCGHKWDREEWVTDDEGTGR